VFYVVIVRVTVEMVFDILRGIIRAFRGAVCGMLNFLAPKLPSDFTESLAWFLVKFEAVMFRSRLFRSRKPRIQALPRRRNVTVHLNSSSRTFTRLSNVIRFVIMAPPVIAGSLLVALLTLAWKLVQLTPSNLVAVLTTLWYLDLL